MAKTMMAPSRMNKASMPCLGASMRSPGELWAKLVQKEVAKQICTKTKQNSHHERCVSGFKHLAGKQWVQIYGCNASTKQTIKLRYACKAWLYFKRADLPQLAGALTNSAKDVRPQVPFLAMSGYECHFLLHPNHCCLNSPLR
jgi:hypothetical protein